MPNLDDVLAMVQDGGKLDAIADLTGYPKGEIVRVARENGYALNVSSNRFQPTPAAKPKPAGIVRTQTTGAVQPEAGTSVSGAAPVPTIRPAHRDLITEGKASSVAKVRRAAERAEAALQALADALDETRAAEAERRAREAEKAKKAARIAELKAELARLTGKAPTAVSRTTKASGAPSPAKAIRSWAEANGVDCPANGPVPRRVVEAYEAAIGGAA